jgi:hypothetical protein
MPRAVKPWTWIRAFRDHGPRDSHFIAAMSMMYSRLDAKTGSAFVGVHRWARESGMHARTLTKCRDKAIELGWLNCPNGIRNRTKTVYRCCVPDHVVLGEKDEELTLAHTAEYGDVETVAPRVLQIEPNCGTQSATDSDNSALAPNVEPLAPKVEAQSVALGASSEPNLWHSTPQSVALEAKSVALKPESVAPRVPRKLLEALEALEVTHSEEGAIASDGTTAVCEENDLPTETKSEEVINQGDQKMTMPLNTQPARRLEPIETRKSKAATAIRNWPDMPTEKLAKMYSLTEAEVLQLQSATASA